MNREKRRGSPTIFASWKLIRRAARGGVGHRVLLNYRSAPSKAGPSRAKITILDDLGLNRFSREHSLETTSGWPRVALRSAGQGAPSHSSRTTRRKEFTTESPYRSR